MTIVVKHSCHFQWHGKPLVISNLHANLRCWQSCCLLVLEICLITMTCEAKVFVESVEFIVWYFAICRCCLRVLQWLWYAEATWAFVSAWGKVWISSGGCTSHGAPWSLQGISCQFVQVPPWTILKQDNIGFCLFKVSSWILVPGCFVYSFGQSTSVVLEYRFIIVTCCLLSWNLSRLDVYIDGDRGQVWGVVPETCCGNSWIGRPAGEVQSVGRLAFQSLCAPQCMQSCTVGILYLLLIPSVMWWFMHIIQWMQVLLCSRNVEGLISKTSPIWTPIFLEVKGPIVYHMTWLSSFTNYAQLSSISKHCHSHCPTTSRVMWYSLSDRNGYTCVVLI